MTETDRPTVAFVLPIGLTLGGSNTWSVKVAGHLAARGWKAALIEHTCVKWHPRWDVAIPAGVRHVVCPGPTPVEAGEKDLASFAETYRSVLPAILIPNFSAAAYAACARLAGETPDRVRLIGVGHGHNESYTSLLRYYEPVIHTFIAKNDGMAASLRTLMPARAGDIFMKPYAVEVAAVVQRAYAGPGEPLRLAYAGRITDHEKRVSNFVPLARALGRLGVNFHMRIIGEGGYKAWLKHEVSELPGDLPGRISVEDMMLPEQLDAVWRQSDVCLLVSNTESGGISMLEAMAQGCVPLSTRTEGPSGIVRHGVDGFLVAIDDMEDMAHCIQQLDRNRELLKQMGAHAHQTVLERFSYEKYVPWFIDLVNLTWGRAPRAWVEQKPLLMPLPRGQRRHPLSTLRGLLSRVLRRTGKPT